MVATAGSSTPPRRQQACYKSVGSRLGGRHSPQPCNAPRSHAPGTAAWRLTCLTSLLLPCNTVPAAPSIVLHTNAVWHTHATTDAIRSCSGSTSYSRRSTTITNTSASVLLRPHTPCPDVKTRHSHTSSRELLLGVYECFADLLSRQRHAHTCSHQHTH